jgi:hypothetical protein
VGKEDSEILLTDANLAAYAMTGEPAILDEATDSLLRDSKPKRDRSDRQQRRTEHRVRGDHGAVRHPEVSGNLLGAERWRRRFSALAVQRGGQAGAPAARAQLP